jgi:hypothetical protein
MRLSPWVTGLLFVSAAILLAQTAEDPQISTAKAHLAQIEKLVEAGAAPRAQLEQVKEEIADSEDAAVLRRTIYSRELTDAQSEEMIAAATRRYERREVAFDKAKKLVDLGVATQASLTTVRDDMDMAGKERELAVERADVVHKLTLMAQAEEALEQRLATAPATAPEVAERYDGYGAFSPRTFARVESAFEGHFGKPLPVSAMGETAVHRAMGFDHTGRVDVALNPDQPEGVWLRAYLAENHIPYFAFRQAVPGKATGAHIHIGPQSARLAHGG